MRLASLPPGDPLLVEQAKQIAACASKAWYARRHEALLVAVRRERAGGKALRVYRCPMCGHWHLTSNKTQREGT